MTPIQREFLEKYYKAHNTCSIADWADATLAAKCMYNCVRESADNEEERAIAKAAEQYATM